MNKKALHIALCLFILLCAAGCDTTSRIATGEVLYTGVKTMKVESNGEEKVPGYVVSEVEIPLSVAPNNALISPTIRSPFPIGLWAWNRLYTEKGKGFKHWMYNKLSKEPVLISTVQPDVRLKVSGYILDNYGYFGSTSRYELHVDKKDPKKARVSYWVEVNTPAYTYNSIVYPPVVDEVTSIIDTLKSSSLLRVGAQYNIDSLKAEKDRLVYELRNRGYYYFQDDFLEYLADTSNVDRKVDLRLVMRGDVPAIALRKYLIGDIYISLQNYRPGVPDTMYYQGLRIAYQRRIKIRKKLLANSLTLTPGELFTIDSQNQTLTNLNRLGIFRYTNINVSQPDSLRTQRMLDVFLDAGFDMQLEGEFELDVNSKSTSFLGPGAMFSVSNKNLFKGGEVISVSLGGAYEWQTGSRNSEMGNSSLLNSYELKTGISLAFPRLLVPRFIPKNPKYPNRTTFQIGVDLLNRPKFFRMLSFSGSMRYDFQTMRTRFHSFTPFKLAYNRLLNTTAEFDSTMVSNPAVKESFKNQFVPTISYSYTYDRPYGFRNSKRFIWQNTVTQAGNILSGVMTIFSDEHPKRLFGNEYSQFVKNMSEVRYSYKLNEKMSIASRLGLGIGYAYGNSTVMPYSEQFYIGGANSIRAFTIRSLGPGGYNPFSGPGTGNKYAYMDQTGDFKLEANVEFRFNIISVLNGAIFLDMGNVWLLKDDPRRPGSGITSGDFFDKIAVGTGCGLRVDISYLVVRLDWGIGLHVPFQDTVKKGYYNIDKFKDGMGVHLAIGYPF